MSNNIKSSFGVEVELLIGIRRTGPMMATPRMFQLAKGKPIIPEPGNTTTAVVQRQVEEVIRVALQGHEGDRVITKPEELTDAEGSHLRRYTGWGVGRDMSVMAFNLERDMTVYDWQDLEITSPALFATEKSFAEVHHVLTAIYNNFWVFAPETAGLHIHYGRGKEWVPIHHLRRIAAFLYAADPILTQMHPPHRRETERNYCPSNRHYSVLAHGISSAQAGRYLGVGNLVEEHHEEDPGPSPPGSAPEPKPGQEKGPRFTPIFKRGTLEGYKFDKTYFTSGELEWAEGEYLPGRQVDKSLDIQTAVRELLSAPSSPVISTLMQHRIFRRCAYNFAAYSVEAYGAVQIYGAGPLLRAQPKRTIEFRQATGTVNADEVVAHARIAVRLCEFACETDINALWIMILDFLQAETQPTWYDVFDLLFELGLANEAKVIQRQMAKQRGIEIVNEELVLVDEPLTLEGAVWLVCEFAVDVDLEADDEEPTIKLTGVS
ncbi:uncharacterized protein F4817DRAFT_367066 [Daldinia loculata]|uniref:uncharacterized protein n=1 Tax=Daldinia loculata TaxID=103429 RepID=UPI0020C3560D|nr:uncharacterized protein F4817DRAFT_367066 [Daldinia loculata]KAI1645204.1 hypothetical protein F4817DRAFT_367066 [Daldinia loculata]